jgi:hypothetical protein
VLAIAPVVIVAVNKKATIAVRFFMVILLNIFVSEETSDAVGHKQKTIPI